MAKKDDGWFVYLTSDCEMRSLGIGSLPGECLELVVLEEDLAFGGGCLVLVEMANGDDGCSVCLTSNCEMRSLGVGGQHGECLELVALEEDLAFGGGCLELVEIAKWDDGWSVCLTSDCEMQSLGVGGQHNECLELVALEEDLMFVVGCLELVEMAKGE